MAHRPREERARRGGRGRAVVNLAVLLFSLYPISRAAAAGDRGSVVLLLALDGAVLVTWVLIERWVTRTSRRDARPDETPER